ncbi:MAG: glycosyltransferase [Candidatus Brocadiaceae bacterium]|nr:glycosyltransferase [Candidatus Brocadiaceae bacterium]
MKFLKITHLDPFYINKFYHERPGLFRKTYDEQKAAFEYDGFGSADFWTYALKAIGYEAEEVYYNVKPIQRAWALENGFSKVVCKDSEKIALEQIKKFKPDVIWFWDCHENLLKCICSQKLSIKLSMCDVGSAIPNTNAWQYFDLVLSCAQESVEQLKRLGVHAKQIHHGFDPRINERLQSRNTSVDVTFIGRFIRETQFHLEREKLFEDLCEKINVQIYSPNFDGALIDDVKNVLRTGVSRGLRVLRKTGFPIQVFSRIPGIDVAALLKEKPGSRVSMTLKSSMRSGVFGLQKFQVLQSSKVTLNMHADSSPVYASNMRLFESTGVGACLVTDWKKNINELFEPDKEIITYKSTEECVEKVKWLMNNPKAREEIACAGQRKTLKNHTYQQRVLELDQIIRISLKEKGKNHSRASSGKLY